ncbi:hypothetical protein VTL71DRAFT_8227 [Oculimacula yallundae]|uniref:DNA2/NAM7 helicase helicase domain-containing protein n=1 Tax=Oculimacula yallundae TaxID=86028 RepID=A0ABR4CZE3_9HELO
MPPRSRAGRQSRGDARGGARGRHGEGQSSRGGSGGRGGRRPNGEGGGQRRPRVEETPEEKVAKASYNAWRRIIKELPMRNDTRTIERLWNGALDILNGNHPGWKQQLIFDLDSDEYYGRDHIKSLMEMQTGFGGSSTFVRLGKPFHLVITHQALLDCLAVDTAVGGIFNFIGGSHGSRAMPFFQKFCKSLLAEHLDITSAASDSFEQLLIALPKAVHELLRRENRASFNEELPDLLNSIEEMSEVILADKHSVTFRYVGNKVGELRRIVARSQGLLHEEEPTVEGITTGVVMSTYPRAIEIPQGRHDNDKADISEIKIIPTEEEIRSSLPEYLPSTNLDIPHFLNDQAQRHLDTHFRLLRHDIFGELKEALGGLILAAEQNTALLENPRLNLGNIRAYAYPMTEIHELSFNHRRGLEVQLSFPHPQAIRNKTKAQRRRWWEDSKRLEDGIFFCLLSFEEGNNSLLLFNVSGKETSPEKPASLSSDDHFATITAKLASGNHRDLDTTWIIPDRLEHQVNNTVPFDIPAPTYARDRNFAFSLKAILKDGAEDVLIHPMDTSSHNVSIIDKVEAQTTLDRGQCEALVSALSHEFVQIQGPPGTGKSYLGVNLMRVLLSSAVTTKLGPIIVVCYTNHALDQFLEHLLDVGVEKLVRVEGSSKSSRLEGKNLRVIAKEEGKSKLEGYICAMTYQELENQEEPVETMLGSIHISRKQPSWTMLKGHLAGQYSTIHSQFNRIDQDGYQTVGRDPFDIWLSDWKEHDEMDFEDNTIEQLLEIADHSGVYNISPFDRARLAEHWVSEIRKDLSDDLYETMKVTEGL